MPTKSKYDPRKLMEMAIEIMWQSVPEPRTDGMTSPTRVIFAQCAALKSPEPDWFELKRQCL